jgi:hypothetical protein
MVKGFTEHFYHGEAFPQKMEFDYAVSLQSKLQIGKRANQMKKDSEDTKCKCTISITVT